MKLFTLRQVPNTISAIRIVLVVPVALLIASGDYYQALLLFVIAAVSDGLDGYIARRFDCSTHLGGWLDPIADKLMQVTTFFMLMWTELVPLWLFLLVVGRDVVLVLGGVLYYLFFERVDAEPSFISKLNTVAQILLIVTVLYAQLYALPSALTIGMMTAVTLTTAWSGLHYVYVWSRRAIKIKQDQGHD